MPYYYVIIISVLILAFLIAVQFSSGVKKPIRKGFLSMTIGVLSLVAVNLLSGVTGVSLPVSVLSLGVSAAGGIPGVTLMLVLNMIM